MKTLLTLISALLIWGHAHAAVQDHSAYEVNIPAQRLDQALQALADVSGARFSYQRRLDFGTRTLAVKGEMTIEQALNRMLMGTGLTWEYDDFNRYTIKSRLDRY